jgi:hypothetical protein
MWKTRKNRKQEQKLAARKKEFVLSGALFNRARVKSGVSTGRRFNFTNKSGVILYLMHMM